jgi:2-polyprenyl-3-methyl-5-hydroxy-6-metoxy-1,4-benzoquinol methylase
MLRVTDVAAQERDKYSEIWGTVAAYRNHSPGLENVERFMSVINPKPGASLIDIGCGEGVAGLAFERHGLAVTYLDITDAGLSPDVDRSRFIEAPLWSRWPKPAMAYDHGFCCDVMEHIPTEYVMLVLDRILSNCRMAWFQIALRPDNFGKAIGQPLHLTVRPFAWWLVRLGTIAKVIEARDLCGDGLYVVERS